MGAAFFTSLVWWELIILGFLLFEMSVSLYNESALGFVVGFVIVTFVNWGGVGSLWATTSMVGLVYYSLLFIAIGIGWSLFKWKLIVQSEINVGKQYNRSREEVKEEINRKKNYDTISYWILLWPFSLLGYLVNDFIYDTMKKLINKIYTLYDRITDRLLMDYKDHEDYKDY